MLTLWTVVNLVMKLWVLMNWNRLCTVMWKNSQADNIVLLMNAIVVVSLESYWGCHYSYSVLPWMAKSSWEWLFNLLRVSLSSLKEMQLIQFDDGNLLFSFSCRNWRASTRSTMILPWTEPMDSQFLQQRLRPTILPNKMINWQFQISQMKISRPLLNCQKMRELERG